MNDELKDTGRMASVADEAAPGAASPVDAAEPEAAPAEKKRRRTMAVIGGVATAAVLAACGGAYAAGILSPKPAPEPSKPAPVEKPAKADEKPAYAAKLALAADDGKEAATPAFAVLTPVDEKGEATGNATVAVLSSDAPGAYSAELPALATGSYKVHWITPITAEGGIYSVPEDRDIDIEEDEPFEADGDIQAKPDATDEEKQAAIDELAALGKTEGLPDDAKDAIEDAIAQGGEAMGGIKPSEGKEDGAEEDKKDEGGESGENKPADANGGGNNSQGTSPSGGSSSGNGGASQGGSSSGSSPQPGKPAHTHNWVQQYKTEQAWVPNNVWVPEYAWVTDYICNNCGHVSKTIDEANAHPVRGGSCNNYHSNSYQVESGGHYEDRGHYTSQSVPNGYACSCGATKQ